MENKIITIPMEVYEALRKFEAMALPILDAYDHMHTRALRAEARVKELEKSS